MTSPEHRMRCLLEPSPRGDGKKASAPKPNHLKKAQLFIAMRDIYTW